MSVFITFVISCVLYVSTALGDGTACPNTILGDVSLDGRVNGWDGNLIRRYLAGASAFSPCQRITADVDGDSNITSGDLHIIRSYIVQIIKSLPVVYGDVTHNGMVSSLDAAYVAGYIAGTRTFTQSQIHLADVNRDGIVDGLDVDLIAAVAVHNLAKLPLPK